MIVGEKYKEGSDKGDKEQGKEHKEGRQEKEGEERKGTCILPDNTVKTAAKALSLSPSMTLLEWKSSRHMRLKPTTSSRM